MLEEYPRKKKMVRKNRRKISKKGLSTIIVTLILILISLVAIGVFWVVIQNLIDGNTENVGLDKLTLSAEIKGVNIDNSSNNVTLAIKRNVGEGDLVGMKFVFYNDSSTEIIAQDFELEQLVERKFVLHLVMNVSTLTKISIVPLFRSSKGEENVGNIADSYDVRTGKRIETPTTEPPAGCTPTVNPCGSAVCGTAQNGTCGNVSCGTCGSGYDCIGGTCVLQLTNTYYVDRNNLSGLCNDAYVKTENNLTHPWCTIQRAANLVVAGDTIIVHPGIYNERITFSSGHSGSAGNKITFKAEPRRASVVLNGFNTQNSNYLRIEGFNITNKRTEWDMVYGVWLMSSYVEVVDNYFYDINDSAVRGPLGTPYPTGGYIVNNTIYRCKTGLFINAHNTLIENNNVERLIYLQSSWVNDCDYARFFGENITFKNNRFYGTSLAEIGSAHADCFQTYTNNGEITRNILFQNNSCSDAHQGLMASNTQATDSYNLTFKNNLFFNLWAFGVGSSGIRNITMEHNTLVNTTYYGFTFSEATTSEVNGKNNILYNVQTPYATQTSAVATFDYNLRYLCGAPNPAGLAGVHDLVDVNPLFVNLNNKDFRLQSGSPACNGGEGGTYLGAYPCN